jgi:ribosomal protein S18 acetylase RimI-like enzyme
LGFEAVRAVPEPILRDYRPGDFPAVEALWAATGLGGAHRGDGAPVVEATLVQGGRLRLLESEGRILGTAWLTCDGRRTYLHHFGILPDVQGRGLGRRLLEDVLEAARGIGLQVKLEVGLGNARARDLYLRAGFRPLGDYEVLILRRLP